MRRVAVLMLWLAVFLTLMGFGMYLGLMTAGVKP